MLKQSFNWLGQQRVDLPHLRMVESGAIFDFSTLFKFLHGDTPYIIRGFNVADGAIIGTPANQLQIEVSDAVISIPTHTEAPFLRVETGTPNEVLSSSNTKVVGSFTASSVNYISINFARATDPSTKDLVAFWDIDGKVEFTKTVPLGRVLYYKFEINTTGFGSNAPLAIVTTDSANNIINITNSKQGLFRLGAGGLSPDPSDQWAYSQATENPLTKASGGVDPYVGGDWELGSFKQWADAVMTEIKKAKGSPFWYSNGVSGSINLTDLFQDSVGSVMTGAGRFVHSYISPGTLSWTSDLYIESIIGENLKYVVTANSATMNDGDVAYIEIVRNNDFQPASTFTFTNGSATVSSTLAVTGISSGDYIKFFSHDITKWIEVLSVVGSTITLVSPYQGATAIGKAHKAQKTYSSVQVSAPNSITPSGNVYWLAKRSDHPFASLAITDASRTSNAVTLTVGASHGLVQGQSILVSGISDATFNGQYYITGVAATTVTYNNAGVDVAPLGAGGTVSKPAKVYVRNVGELHQGEDVQIDDQVSEELLSYIGSPGETVSVPVYNSYSTGSLDLPSYNTSSVDNLTVRLSKLTAMLADHTQDRNIEWDLGDVTWDGSNLTISNAQLSVPGTTVGASPVSINNLASTPLAANQCIYLDISRTSGSALTLSAATAISSLTPAQQRFVVARRIGSDLIVRQ